MTPKRHGTAIEWTHGEGMRGETWNPVTGCSKVSPGCAHCYAETLTSRFAGRSGWPETFLPWTPNNAAENVEPRHDRLTLPLGWRSPRMVFVNSMSDLFHERISDTFIAQVWQVMAETPQHTYQVLTKRPERMIEFVDKWIANSALDPYVDDILPNVWLGVSAENQRWLDVRVPLLLETPAAIKFVSCEPLLGPLDIHRYTHLQGLNWVIVGGESGPKHRPIQTEWVRDIRDDCTREGIPFFFKQWGGRTPKAGGRLLDGKEWNQMPRLRA